jgi:hypothetical protein
MNKQLLCDEIMLACGRNPVPLGPGSKEPRIVLEAAWAKIYSNLPDPSLSKITLLDECLRYIGGSLEDHYHSSGNTVTESGLKALLDAVLQMSRKPNITYSTFTTDATPYAAQQQQWIAGSLSTADTLKEFIDNSFSAFHARPSERRGSSLSTFPTVTVTVDYEKKELQILDDAGGMTGNELNNALQTGSTSGPNITGMSGFGVGIKQAATWFVGTTGKWAIESAMPGSDIVETRELLETAPGAVSASYKVGQRQRIAADPGQEIGFTRVILCFNNERALKEKVYSSDGIDAGDPAARDMNVFAPAIRLDLEYTYARFLEGARDLVPGISGGAPVMQPLPTRLAIVWVEVIGSRRITKTLSLPPDPSDNPDAKPHQRVASMPAAIAAEYKITHCYQTGSGEDVTRYWWTSVDLQIEDPYWEHIGPVRANVRVAEDQTLTHQPSGAKGLSLLSSAERNVHQKYSRGTRLYYNDRLICVLAAPQFFGYKPGTNGAKNLLAEIEIGAIDRALAETPGVNRLLASNKAAVNLAGTPNSLMTEVEGLLKQHLRRCIVTADNVKPSSVYIKTLHLLKFAEKSLNRRNGEYPPIPGSQPFAPPTVTPPVTTPPVPPLPKKPIGPVPPAAPPRVRTPDWKREGLTQSGDWYQLTAGEDKEGGYQFVVQFKLQGTGEVCTYRTPEALPGSDPVEALSRIGETLLISISSSGRGTTTHRNSIPALEDLLGFVKTLRHN